MQESPISAWTPRVDIRCPTEPDRARFVELFCDHAFMAFSGGPLSRDQAHARFDRMHARCAELSFAKQPIIERSSGAVIGYTGVDWIEFDGDRWLEWGYRLVPAARGKGYAGGEPRSPRGGPQRLRRGDPWDHPPPTTGPRRT
jgi:RimJ/RimL family protein N-acetyltransferase